MSHRRPDPGQAVLEHTLRRALRLAADSIEPAGDGLERIRGKIAAGPPPPMMATGWAARRARYLSGLLAVLMTVAWYLEPIGKRLWYAFAELADRFRPDAEDTRKVRWLRPAGALTAAFVVVAGLSFAITTVPPALIEATGKTSTPHADNRSGGGGPSSGNSGSPNGSGTQSSQGPNSSPNSSTSCSTGPSSSGTPSPSPSPSPTTSSPSTSPSPSPTPTTSSPDTGSPSASPSPTDSATGQASQPADSSQPASPSTGNIPGPTSATSKSSPHPTASGTKGPCRG
jgi:hypothetical protein